MITLTRSRNIVDYNANGESFSRTTVFNDLDIKFNNKFSFSNDVQQRISKGRSMIGFLKRHIGDFNDLTVSKTLDISLVRSNLE